MHMTETKSNLLAGSYQNLGMKTFWLMLYNRLSGPFGFLFLAAMSLVAMKLQAVPIEIKPYIGYAGLAFVAIFALSGVIVTITAWFSYTRNLFCLDTDALKIKRGFFTVVETAFPYRQIQNVEIERRLLFQLMGLSKLIVVTAADDDEKTERNEASGIFPMIDKELAEELRDELLRRSDVQRAVIAK
jgi:membrane protein YdbS with pleckstrin-like domain